VKFKDPCYTGGRRTTQQYIGVEDIPIKVIAYLIRRRSGVAGFKTR